MNRKPNQFRKTKLPLIILFCVFLLVSCKRAENICTLTPEQAPEIRGFRLGMSFEEIQKKFPEICKPYTETENKVVFQLLFFKRPNTDCEPIKYGKAQYFLNPEQYNYSKLLFK